MIFIAEDKNTKEIVKTANIFRHLQINAFISGGVGSGKSTLAHFMLPNAKVANAVNENELYKIVKNSQEIIIENFNLITNYNNLNFENKKVIGISPLEVNGNIIDKFFGIKINLLDLKDRPDDIAPLADCFSKMAKEIFAYKESIKLDFSKFDLSQNIKSLKRSVYFQILSQNIDENELLYLMEVYLSKRIEGSNDYREYLYLYDKPLIKAGLKKYGSQLKLSDILGLNRNTLRKKIQEIGL